MLQYLLYAGGIVGLFALSCFALWITERVRFWKLEGKKYANPGYFPPQATRFGRIFRYLASRVTSFLYLGPVRIHNKQYLRDKRRLLILPNHRNERDTIVATRLLGLLKARYLIASTQLTPERAPWVAFTGGISVDHANNPGGAARTAARALGDEPDTACVIFPEGQLHRDGTLKREDFHNGAVRITRLAAKKSKTEFACLPVYIRYEYDKAKAGLLQRLLLAFGLKRWRLFFAECTYGVDIYLGNPIRLAELPEDAAEATGRIFDEIVRLSQEAEKLQGPQLGDPDLRKRLERDIRANPSYTRHVLECIDMAVPFDLSAEELEKARKAHARVLRCRHFNLSDNADADTLQREEEREYQWLRNRDKG